MMVVFAFSLKLVNDFIPHETACYDGCLNKALSFVEVRRRLCKRIPLNFGESL